MTLVANAASVAAGLLAAHAAVNAKALRPLPPPASAGFVPMISVLVPARNEAASIGACLSSILASKDVVIEVLVLDDGSSDDTASIVEGYADTDRRVRLIAGTPLPSGWLGKPHACAQLAAAASAPLLAFIDADVRITPDALARAAAALHTWGLGLVSPYPRQLAITPAERLVQPLLQWSWLSFLPLRLAERSPLPALVAANGQLLVCRRDVYRAAGGHAVVSDAVLDDIELARAVKRVGQRATVADGTDIAECRMYAGWREVRDGYSKSLWAATRTPAGGAGLAATLLWLFVLPPAAAARRLTRGGRGAALPLLGYGAGVAGRVIAARRTGGVERDALAHPLSVAALVALQLRSLVLHRLRRLSWKDRPIP